MRVSLVEPLVLSAVLLGCVAGQSEQSEQRDAKSALTEMKESWKMQSNEFRDSKSFWQHSVEVLKTLLRTAPTNVVQAEVDRLCRTAVPRSPQDPPDFEKSYDNALLEAMLEWSIEEKDSSRLKALLAANCPYYVGNVPLEYYVATKWRDAVLLLCDWCAEAKTSEAKKNLLHCLGRAFPALRTQYRDDTAFLAQAQRWYRDDDLEINSAYPHLMGVDPMVRFGPGEKGLFILKRPLSRARGG